MEVFSTTPCPLCALWSFLLKQLLGVVFTSPIYHYFKTDTEFFLSHLQLHRPNHNSATPSPFISPNYRNGLQKPPFF